MSEFVLAIARERDKAKRKEMLICHGILTSLGAELCYNNLSNEEDFMATPDNGTQFTDSVEISTISSDFLTYIKEVSLGDDGMGYAVCTEDGLQLAVFESEEAAMLSARQHNLTPVRLH
jgi:hypothetical protein